MTVADIPEAERLLPLHLSFLRFLSAHRRFHAATADIPTDALRASLARSSGSRLRAAKRVSADPWPHSGQSAHGTPHVFLHGCARLRSSIDAGTVRRGTRFAYAGAAATTPSPLEAASNAEPVRCDPRPNSPLRSFPVRGVPQKAQRPTPPAVIGDLSLAPFHSRAVTTGPPGQHPSPSRKLFGEPVYEACHESQ